MLRVDVRDTVGVFVLLSGVGQFRVIMPIVGSGNPQLVMNVRLIVKPASSSECDAPESLQSFIELNSWCQCLSRTTAC